MNEIGSSNPLSYFQSEILSNFRKIFYLINVKSTKVALNDKAKKKINLLLL